MLVTLSENGFLLLTEGEALLPFELSNGVVRLALPLVTEALVEHQRQDVVLVVLSGGLSPQDARRAPKVRLKLLECESHEPYRARRRLNSLNQATTAWV